jgi:glutamine amidotransferase
MISLVDYGMGNLRSVEKAFAQAGADVTLITTPDEVAAAEKLVVPGVGAFGDAMKSLVQTGVAQALKDAAAAGKPLLGICLGAQLLFDYSEEEPEVPGLGILRGGVKLFAGDMGLKVPHMGWNTLHVKPDSRVLAGLGQSPHVYFVHSYYMAPEDAQLAAAVTSYGIDCASAVERENIFGVQFHPEKSQDLGLKILANFAAV